MYTYTYMCIYLYILTHTHTHAYVHQHTYIGINLPIHRNICTRTYIYIYAHQNNCANTCKRTTRTWKQAEKFAKCPKQKCTCTKHNTMLDTYFWKSPKKSHVTITHISQYESKYFFSPTNPVRVCVTCLHIHTISQHLQSHRNPLKGSMFFSLFLPPSIDLCTDTQTPEHTFDRTHTHTPATHMHTLAAARIGSPTQVSTRIITHTHLITHTHTHSPQQECDHTHTQTHLFTHTHTHRSQ